MICFIEIKKRIGNSVPRAPVDYMCLSVFTLFKCVYNLHEEIFCLIVVKLNNHYII
jgi:hypothetical protein